MHCQYVVSYAYSRYVNVCLTKKEKKKKDITAGRAEDAPFPASTQDPLLVLLLRSSRRTPSPTLLTPSIAVQADVPSPGANSYTFFFFFSHFGERHILSRGGCKVTRNNRNCLPPRLSEREGELCESG